MADRVPAAVDHAHHEGEARLTGAQISAINRFPDDNPNPVLRIDADGHLIYANPASAGVLQALAARRLGIAFRVGVHCGPVVAGVIGTKKFIYDIWGDTVNLASRMESLGVPGKVQVTHAVQERLGDAFQFESRGLVDVKGKGPIPTWFVVDQDAAMTPVSVMAAPSVRSPEPRVDVHTPPRH